MRYDVLLPAGTSPASQSLKDLCSRIKVRESNQEWVFFFNTFFIFRRIYIHRKVSKRV